MTAALLLAIVALPGGILGWLLANPRNNLLLFVPNEHFVIVTTVALLALVVALLVARVTLEVAHYRAFFFALGFMAMAGFFVVHALATPGVLVDPSTPGYGGSGGSVIEFSAFLSLFVPSILFAASYTNLASAFTLRRGARLGPGAPILILLVVLVLYGVLAMSQPQVFARVMVNQPPASYGLAVVSVALFTFVAWRQARLFQATQLPLSGAFVVGFLLLALAQISMVLGPVWTLAWWEYHLLMYAAVVLALGGILFEYRQGRPLRHILEGALELELDAGLGREDVDTVTALAAATELKDPDARGHTRRVAALARELARELGLPRDEWPALARAALLHDAGHLAIPDAVFLKEGAFSADEWEMMKQHVERGREILDGLGGLKREATIVAAHHERLDGQGYPRGLSGDAIPLAARILAVVDTFDALCMDRPYRSAKSTEEALDLIYQEAGTHLDPQVVAALARILRRRGTPNSSTLGRS